MRLGLFGGSFDPIHRGHVEPVKQACRILDLDRVIYLPTASPPHKARRTLAPPAMRYAMVELALLDECTLEVSDFELTPGEATYTIDSIEHFARLHEGSQLALLIGEDSLLALETWRRWGQIVDQVEIGVLSRPGLERDELLRKLPGDLRQARDDRRLRFVDNELVAVSSSEVRRRLSKGDFPGGEALAPLVLKYLRKYPNLYA